MIKAKLNLNFEHNKISMNYAVAKAVQSQYGIEEDWNIGTLKFDIKEEFEQLAKSEETKNNDNYIKLIYDNIDETVTNWQSDSGYDFDNPIEITISTHFLNINFLKSYSPYHESKEITEQDIKFVREIVGMRNLKETIYRHIVSPYFRITEENSKKEIKVLNPLNRKSEILGIDTCFIVIKPMLLKLIDLMKQEDKDMDINVSLSCEKEFQALANENEKKDSVMLININESLTEFSIWENSELKYLNNNENNNEASFAKVIENIWRLCIAYYKNHSSLIKHEFKLVKEKRSIESFFEQTVKKTISEDSKELLSADDCLNLIKSASCVEENLKTKEEIEDNLKCKRFELLGKNDEKTNVTISSYVLNYFAKESVRSLFYKIKKIMDDNNNFCKPNSIIVECSWSIKGIEEIAAEVFKIPARRAVAKWNKKVQENMLSGSIGALQSLISTKEFAKKITNNNATASNKKDTSKLETLFKSIFKSS